MNLKYPITILIDQNTYSISQIKKEQIDQLTDLFNEARSRKLDHLFFHKKYNTRWTGIENVAIVVTDDKGKLLGHLGVLPTPILLKGKKIMSGQISDAVLDPKLRGKNVFNIIIQELEQLSKSLGIEFLWVAPSPQAINGFKANKWELTNQIITYTMPVKTIPLNKISNKFNLDKLYRLYIRLVLLIFSREKKYLLNPNFNLNHGGVDITTLYVEHKNYSSNYLVERNNFTFWFKIEDGIEIGNIAYFEPSNKNSFIKSIQFIAKILGCHQVKIITSNGTFQDQLFSNLESIKNNPIYFKRLSDSTVDFNEILFNYSDFNTF